MPAPLHIVLTPEEERTLSELRVARSVSQRTRDRAHMLRLNAPQYSSEMNLIEAQWHQLKTHEIAGRIFDNEYDLANAIIEGMENRSQHSRWTLQRLTFKSA